MRLLRPTLLAALCLAAILAFDGRSSGATAPEKLLPDLTQEVPGAFGVYKIPRTGKPPAWRLGFRSAVGNRGRGPLIVTGHRDSTSDPTMTASQAVKRSDGSRVTRSGVGVLKYISLTTHQHWHLLGFDSYSLRTAKGFRKLRRDRKSGFCLGDRFVMVPRVSGTSRNPPYRETDCGEEQPDLLDIEEGISRGWHDVYSPIREGQYLDLTGLRAGRYYVVHRVNALKRLTESNYKNNAASALLSVSWPQGRSKPPRVRELARCPKGNACTRPRLDNRVKYMGIPKPE